MPTLPSVGVLLTLHKRPQCLLTQIKAIQHQSLRPDVVHIFEDFWNVERAREPRWTHSDYDRYTDLPVKWARCESEGLGVWGRFYYAPAIPTDFICIFDDDTIPGHEWLEHCLEQYMRVEHGIYVAVGIRFKGGKASERLRFGWPNPMPVPMRVNYGGHAWFMPREALSQFVRYPRFDSPSAGEDMHLSASNSLVMPTIVPPHDLTDKSAWGSITPELGRDDSALYRRKGARQLRERAYEFYRDQFPGWAEPA